MSSSASDKIDDFLEFDLQPWDTAAGFLIVSEAGGKVTNMDGSAYSIHKPQLLVTNGNVNGVMIEILRPYISR